MVSSPDCEVDGLIRPDQCLQEERYGEWNSRAKDIPQRSAFLLFEGFTVTGRIDCV